MMVRRRLLSVGRRGATIALADSVRPSALRLHGPAVAAALPAGAHVAGASGQRLFIVCPKPQNLYHAFAFEYLIDDAMLNVDTT